MADSCAYSQILDPETTSVPETFVDDLRDGDATDNETVMWSCPHPIHDGGEHCVFHLEDPPANDEFIDAVQTAFCERLGSTDSRSNQFVGATLPELRLDHRTIDPAGRSLIVFDDATIGSLDLTGARLRAGIAGHDTMIATFVAPDAQIDGSIELIASSVGLLGLSEARVSRPLSCLETEFDYLLADSTTFDDRCSLTDCEIRVGATFERARFASRSDFSRTIFQSAYTGTDFESRERAATNHHLAIAPMMGVRRATERPDDTWVAADCGASEGESEQIRVYYSGRSFVDTQYVHFSDVEVHGADFRDTTFDAFARFDGCTFEYADFSRSTIDEISCLDTAIFGVIYFSGATLSRGEFRFQPIDVKTVINRDTDAQTIDLRERARVFLDEATLADGRLMQPDEGEVFYDIREGVVGDVTVRPRRSAFETLLVGQTTFDGFDFTRYRDSLSELRWEIDRRPLSLGGPDLSDLDRREVTYLKARRGAAAVGDSVSESRFFRRELRYRINLYQKGSVTEMSVLDMYRNLGKILGNRLYRWTTGYGELPRRVVFSYIGFTLLFGTVLVLPVAAESPETVLTVPLRIFEILLYGSRDELPRWLHPVFRLYDRVVIPAFVALLVFTLSRSVDR